MISITFTIISVLVSMNTVVNGNNDNDNNLVAVKPKHHCQQQQRKLEAPIHMNINDDNLPNPMMTTNSNNVDNHNNNDVYYCQSEDGKKYNIKYPNVMNTIPFVTEVNNSRYFNQYTELSDFLEGATALSYYYHQQHQSNSSLTEAICEFRPLKYSRHFPHMYVLEEQCAIYVMLLFRFHSIGSFDCFFLVVTLSLYYCLHFDLH